jgi:hypothetical protein
MVAVRVTLTDRQRRNRETRIVSRNTSIIRMCEEYTEQSIRSRNMHSDSIERE